MIAQNYWALNITNVYLKLPSPGLEMFLLYMSFKYFSKRGICVM